MLPDPLHNFPLHLPPYLLVHSFIYFIFCLSAALPVHLIVPCRVSLLRFTFFSSSQNLLFYLLLFLQPKFFLFGAKMFPLLHFQHLTEHTWNLFMPVSSSTLLFPSHTSQSAPVFIHKYASKVAFLLDTANSVQAPGCQNTFWTLLSAHKCTHSHTRTHLHTHPNTHGHTHPNARTPESGDFLTSMQTH